MQKFKFYEELTVIDNAWGKITLPPKFVKILNHPVVQALKYKKQLGMTVKNPAFIGGHHTRYDHAVGVYYVATKLVAVCKEKFGNFFEISSKEENAFYLSAFLHDLGHRVGSHAFERISTISHEEETYAAIISLKELIDSTFVEGTCDYVLEILNDKNRIKRENAQKQSDKIDLLFVLSELMVGSVDIDRIDYIIRDYLNLYGEKKDFSVLFDYMELELISNRPKIVFNSEALDILEDYLMTRFRLYNEAHFHPQVIIQDEYFKMFVLSKFSPENIHLLFTDTQMDYEISASSPSSVFEHRYKDVLEYGDFSEICYRKFNQKEQAQIFFLKLSQLIETESVNYCGYLERKVTVYDKYKNSILLKNDNETNDITVLSKIIKNKILQNTICIYVDLVLLENYLKEEGKSLDIIEKVYELFKQSDKEIEYKFIASDDKREEVISLLVEKYSKLISSVDTQINEDKYYYVPGVFDPKDGSVRVRCVDGNLKPTIKFSLKDETSLTKRDEHNFSNLSEEEFLSVANEILKQKGFEVDLARESIMVNVKTKRRLYKINFKSSVIELALDKSIYSYFNDSKEYCDTMIEVELKHGKTLELWEFVNNLRESLGKECLIECTESKLSRAFKFLETTKIYG